MNERTGYMLMLVTMYYIVKACMQAVWIVMVFIWLIIVFIYEWIKLNMETEQ